MALGFLSLPAEIRTEIYRLIFDGSVISFSYWPSTKATLLHRSTSRETPKIHTCPSYRNILLSCKTVLNEALAFYHSLSTFEIDSYILESQKFPPRLIENIRCITLCGPSWFDMFRGEMDEAVSQLKRFPNCKTIGFPNVNLLVYWDEDAIDLKEIQSQFFRHEDRRRFLGRLLHELPRAVIQIHHVVRRGSGVQGGWKYQGVSMRRVAVTNLSTDTYLTASHDSDRQGSMVIRTRRASRIPSRRYFPSIRAGIVSITRPRTVM